MNYLTQYYKNLSEQLQERVNQLQEQVKLLNEVGDTPAGQEALMRYHGSAHPVKRAAGRAQAAKRLGAHGEIEVEDYETAPDEDGGQMFKVKGRTEKGVPVEYETPRQFGMDVPTPKSGRLTPKELSTLAFGKTPSPKNLTPNRFDGPDADKTGSTEEVVAGQNMDNAMRTHNDLASLIAHAHSLHAPHIQGNRGPDVAASRAHIVKELSRKGRPMISHENIHSVLADIEEVGEFAPYSIQGESGEHDRGAYNKIMDKVGFHVRDVLGGKNKK